MELKTTFFPRIAALLLFVGCPFSIPCVLTGGLRACAAEVKLETSDGSVVTGQWAGATQDAVRLDDGAKVREFPLDGIVSLGPVAADGTSTGPPTNVTLIDGTSIYALEVTMDESTVTIQPRRQSTIRMPIKQLRCIRFRLGASVTDPQWFGLMDQELRSDMMVIRRGNDQLDPIDGVVVGLDPQNLLFELDGDKIEAPRDRLEGVFFRSSADTRFKSNVKVTDVYGSTFLTSRLEPSDAKDSIGLMLPGQVRHEIPIEQIRKIVWSSGRILLASEKAAESDVSLYLKTRLPDALTEAWFSPVAEGDDIIAAAGGSIEYRVADGFQTLEGSVVREATVAAAGATIVRISVDGVVSWEQTLADGTPKGFRIAVGNARRVRLQVLAGDDGDVGDQVRFVKPRLIK